MIKSKKVILSLVAIALVLGIAGSASAWSRGQGRGEGKQGEGERGFMNTMNTEERVNHRQKMQEIMENEDYQAWSEMMNEKMEHRQERLNQMELAINEDVFAKILEIHELIQDNEFEKAREKARELREEYNFPGMFGRLRSLRQGRWNE